MSAYNFINEWIKSRNLWSSAFFSSMADRLIISLALILFLSFYSTIDAQNTTKNVRLSGKIVVIENNETIPLEYATVRLLSLKDSSLITGTTTDNAGKFELKTTLGSDYILFVTSVGYQNLYQVVKLNANE
ncbi:MAG: carboxypeptidase-like regulatory domain-containing protein [Paludibacter sp.]